MMISGINRAIFCLLFVFSSESLFSHAVFANSCALTLLTDEEREQRAQAFQLIVDQYAQLTVDLELMENPEWIKLNGAMLLSARIELRRAWIEKHAQVLAAGVSESDLLARTNELRAIESKRLNEESLTHKKRSDVERQEVNVRTVRESLRRGKFTELLTLKGHGELLCSAQFSPNDQKIVTASFDQSSFIWDATTGRQIMPLKHKDKAVYAEFSPDGKKIVTVINQLGEVWDAETGDHLFFLPGIAWARGIVRFSPDGSKLVASTQENIFDPKKTKNHVTVWDATTGDILNRFRNSAYFNSVEFSPDGKRIVAASGGKTAFIWDLVTGKKTVLRGHKKAVRDARFFSRWKEGRHCLLGRHDQDLGQPNG